jgi:hypothetical protein
MPHHAERAVDQQLGADLDDDAVESVERGKLDHERRHVREIQARLPDNPRRKSIFRLVQPSRDGKAGFGRVHLKTRFPVPADNLTQPTGQP